MVQNESVYLVCLFVFLFCFFQSCPFSLEVYCNRCEPTLHVKFVTENRNEVSNKAVLSSVLNNFSNKENVKGMKDLILYRYDSAIRVTLVLQNLVSFSTVILLGVTLFSKHCKWHGTIKPKCQAMGSVVM